VTRDTWNRATKTIVIASTMAAALAEWVMAARLWDALWPATLVATIAAVAAARWARGTALRVVLVLIYLAPACFLLLSGNDHFSYEIVWIAPLLTILVVDPEARDWSLPDPWQLPLVTWALVVSVSWPLVALREFDFSPWLMTVVNVPNTGFGVSPEEVLMWTAYIVLGHNVGLLWIDALFRWYGRVPIARFRIEIMAPLVAGVGVACAVGIYQGFVDLDFLSGHLWPHMRRAAGTLMDANSFGTIAALMGPAAVVLAIGRGGPWSIVRAGFAMALTFMGVWTSGSRTALAAILVGFAVIVYEGWHQGRSNRNVAPIAIGVAIIAGIVGLAGSSTMTVFTRLHSFVPGLEENTTFGSAAWALWQRNGYGSAAMRMVAEHPLQGVGAGIFHTLVLDYRVLVTNVPIPPDNAQNWYRHMLTEFGILGSLPMFMWVALFAKALVSKPASGADRFTVHVLRSTLLAIGLISLLSMSGQSMTIVLTFWTLVFWFLITREPGTLRLRSGQAGSREPGDRRSEQSQNLWRAGAIGLVVVHGALTFAAARGDLLPRHRAARFGWDYSGGISDLEPNADGTPGRRWTGLKAMSTIPVRGKVLKFVGWIDHPDADAKPVHVEVWADGKSVFDGDLKRTDAIRVDIPAREGHAQMVLHMEISRTFRPSEFGRRDRRDLGLAVQDWQWQ
jgi:O-Antigen ligase